MKLKVILIAGGLGLASLGAVGAYAVSPDVRQGVEAGKAAITLAGYRHGRGGHGAQIVQRRPRRAYRGRDLPSPKPSWRSRREQRVAWDRLTGAVRAGSDKVGETCAETEALRAEKTLPAKLALAEGRDQDGGGGPQRCPARLRRLVRHAER